MSSPWIRAFRPRTLTLTIACIGLGSFLAAADGVFSPTIFILALVTAVCLQILSNLANDYGDSIHGADSSVRQGPSRAVQTGAISTYKIRTAIVLCIFLALASGITLLILAFDDYQMIGIFFLLGIGAIWAAVRYTTGERPYGYLGFGDLSVFFFFGWVGVAGTYFLHNGIWYNGVLLPAASVGFLSVAVLNVNNIRDILSDKEAGKRSIPVRIGKIKAVYYHWFLLLGAIIFSSIYVLKKKGGLVEWSFLLILPFWIEQAYGIWKKANQDLDPYLKKTALSTLLYAFLFGLGQYLSSDLG